MVQSERFLDKNVFAILKCLANLVGVTAVPSRDEYRINFFVSQYFGSV